VLHFEENKGRWKKSKKPAKFDAFEWNDQNLNPLSQKYLRSLLQYVRCKIGRFQVFLTHGSPQSIGEPILPDTPQEWLIELGNTADADIIVIGHTHRFMNRKVGHQWFTNPRSFGLPSNNDLRASYALLDISQSKIKVFERKIPYEIS
jgi:predicted phosphodiesterase